MSGTRGLKLLDVVEISVITVAVIPLELLAFPAHFQASALVHLVV